MRKLMKIMKILFIMTVCSTLMVMAGMFAIGLTPSDLLKLPNLMKFQPIPELLRIELPEQQGDEIPNEDDETEVKEKPPFSDNPTEGSGQIPPDSGQDNGSDVIPEKEPEIESYFITSSDMNKLKNISWVDKIKVLSILAKLDKPEANSLADLANGGVTQSEFKIAEQVLNDAIGTKETQKLKDILERNRQALIAPTVDP